jgi:hypothetical protein
MSMSRNRRVAPRALPGAVAAALALAGCETAPPPEAAAPAASRPAEAAGVANPGGPGPRLPAQKPRRHAALPPDDKPEMRLPLLNPDIVVGLDREQTALLLGEPAAVRAQPPATVWSYRTKDCSLNVFFYPDVQTREMRALAYDVIAGEGEQAKNACFAAIRARPKE